MLREKKFRNFLNKSVSLFIGMDYFSRLITNGCVSFLGHRISVDGAYAIETHILNEDLEETEGVVVTVEFLEFLRENKKFENLEALKVQIGQDILQAGNIK